MNLIAFKEERYDPAVESLIDYLNDALEDDCAYTANDIDRCAKIVDGYINDLLALKNRKTKVAILAYVENVVKKLNDLNRETSNQLIAANRAAYLGSIITEAAATAGLDLGRDITYSLREW